jgi:hypothetical protein
MLGVRVFQFPDGLLTTAEEVLETAVLFAGYLTGEHMPEWSVEANVKFMADQMNYTMERRPTSRVDFDESELHSGDVFAIIRLDALDTMLAWAMGAHTGHITMALESPEKPGEFYICEANTASKYWPVDGIQCSKWKDWVEMAAKAEFLVSVLPLRVDVREKFDLKKAWAHVNSMLGLPYGWHTQFTGWIDTAEDNYPGDLSSHLAQILFAIVEFITQVSPRFAILGFLTAL